jgi:multidrug efflux system membrane fusion protein
MLKRVAFLFCIAGLGAAGWWRADDLRGQFDRVVTHYFPQPQRQAGGRARPEGAVVTAVTAEARTMPVLREGVGSVVAGMVIAVRAQVDGRLTSITFREGEMVRKGQVLARLDRAVFEAQLEQAMARQAQNEAGLMHARLELERFERLASANAGTRQQADQQRAVVAQLAAQVRADRAAVDAARINLDHTVILAPADGRAGIRLVDPGNIVRASDATGIVTLAQFQPIAVIFALPQRDLIAVQGAIQRGPVEAVALATDGRAILASGQLDVIDNQIDQATGTIRLKATFDNEDLKLWPGQFVNIRIKVDELKDAVVVPTLAVRRGSSGSFVYRVDEGNKARIVRVEVQQQDEAHAVITGGVSAGQKIITAGFHNLREGASVSVSDDPDVGQPAATAAADGGERPVR